MHLMGGMAVRGEIDVVMVLAWAGGELLRLSAAANGGHGFIRRLAFGLIGLEDGRSKIRGKLAGGRRQAVTDVLCGRMLLV